LAIVAVLASSLVAIATYDKYWSLRDRAAGLAQARQDLQDDLAALGLHLGAPIFIRIFKQSGELEVWLQNTATADWTLFRTYPICNYSGDLGPKLREGDRQSPEGLYEVRQKQLHPTSRYHLAFNLGFPNAFDRANGRSGSYLMVHGNCVSVGCYAMTNRGIEEIYALAEDALNNGQDAFRVHAFPARLDEAWMTEHAGSPWIGFWRDLRSCYDAFEKTKTPPSTVVRNKRYHCI
jgi:murein L,D-transpeptidase YafK